MGADNFVKLPMWEESEKLISNYKFIIFRRKDIELDKALKNNELIKKYIKNFNILDIKENLNCSSGIIRNLIKQDKSELAEKYTKVEVINYINKNKLYI